MTKNFMQDGKWVEKKTTTKIAVCDCGNKYIRTRPRQKACLRCLAETHSNSRN